VPMRPRRSGSQRILFIVKNLYTMERMGVMYLSSYALRLDWSTDLSCRTVFPIGGSCLT